jgi:hypothetical protein
MAIQLKLKEDSRLVEVSLDFKIYRWIKRLHFEIGYPCANLSRFMRP